MLDIPLIPRATLFGNPSRFQARLSPDGAWLTSLAPLEGVLNLWLAPIGILLVGLNDRDRWRCQASLAI
jgi:hypothetical protein